MMESPSASQTKYERGEGGDTSGGNGGVNTLAEKVVFEERELRDYCLHEWGDDIICFKSEPGSFYIWQAPPQTAECPCCGSRTLRRLVSNTPANPGRPFFKCMNDAKHCGPPSRSEREQCSFFVWEDDATSICHGQGRWTCDDGRQLKHKLIEQCHTLFEQSCTLWEHKMNDAVKKWQTLSRAKRGAPLLVP